MHGDLAPLPVASGVRHFLRAPAWRPSPLPPRPQTHEVPQLQQHSRNPHIRHVLRISPFRLASFGSFVIWTPFSSAIRLQASQTASGENASATSIRATKPLPCGRMFVFDRQDHESSLPAEECSHSSQTWPMSSRSVGCVHSRSPSTRAIMSTCIGNGMFRQLPPANSPAQEPQTAVECKSRPTGAMGWEAPPEREARTRVSRYRPANSRGRSEGLHLSEKKGRSVRVRARGVADRARSHETIVLLRLECSLPLGSEMSLHVGLLMGPEVLPEVSPKATAHVSSPHRAAALSATCKAPGTLPKRSPRGPRRGTE